MEGWYVEGTFTTWGGLSSSSSSSSVFHSETSVMGSLGSLLASIEEMNDSMMATTFVEEHDLTRVYVCVCLALSSLVFTVPEYYVQ
jgi:hypothetical protein